VCVGGCLGVCVSWCVLRVKKFMWLSSFGSYTGWHAWFVWTFGSNILLPLFKVKIFALE
jgi:hypothetical protein